MAWPDSANAVISSSAIQSDNIEAFVSDVIAVAETTTINEIRTYATAYIPDPEWVDPFDGSEAPNIPSEYDIAVVVRVEGTHSAANAEIIMDVADALGLN